MKLAVILVLAVLLALISISNADTGHHPAATGHGEHHAAAAVSGGAGSKKGKKYSEHKQVKTSGKKSVHDVEHAKKGETLKELHKKDNEEGGGKKSKHHTEGGYKGFNKSGGASDHGAKFQDAAHHKKSSFKKGFREKYHKDEEKKHDSFYSNAHKTGEYQLFGNKHAKHQTHSVAKKAQNNYKVGKAEDAHGKSGVQVGGHHVAEKKGHQEQKASKSHHDHNTKWAKKGSKKGGKQYKYKIPPGHHKK